MKRLLGAAALAALMAGGTAKAAEESVDITPEFLLNIASGYGSAVMEKLSDGAPVIVGRTDGIRYLVFMVDCEGKPSCSLIQFGASFPIGKATHEVVNAWNRDKRFGKVNIAKD